LVRRKQAAQDEDVLSHLLHAGNPEDNLPPEEVSSIGSLMRFAGYETTANMLGPGTLVLLRHPAELRAKHALDRPFEELLRYPSSGRTSARSSEGCRL
jgi:cytochrome P450